MFRTIRANKVIPVVILGMILFFLIVCPVLSIFVKAIIADDRFNFSQAGKILNYAIDKSKSHGGF